MELVAACLLSFALGSWTVILSQRNTSCDSKAEERKNAIGDGENVTRREETLRAQWESFLNYNGGEQK